MLPGKGCVQFAGKGKTTIDTGISWILSAKDHSKCHNTTGYSTAGATCTPEAKWKSRRQPDNALREAKPERIIDGLDNSF